MDGCPRFQIINVAAGDQTGHSGLVAILDRFIGKRRFEFFFSAQCSSAAERVPSRCCRTGATVGVARNERCKANAGRYELRLVHTSIIARKEVNSILRATANYPPARLPASRPTSDQARAVSWGGTARSRYQAASRKVCR